MPVLSELINGLDYQVINFSDFDVQGIAYHSSQVLKDYIFVAIKGYKIDGHQFIDDAIKNGAQAVVCNRSLDADVTQIITVDTRRAMAELTTRLYKETIDQIDLIGITGTNGKTTTAYLIRSILSTAGLGCGLIGSVEYDLGVETQKSYHTTPEITDLVKMLKQIVKYGLPYAVIEVTSHGLQLKRLFGLRFPIRIFTNLSRDHLDFHPDIDDYKETKVSFFEGLDQETCAVVNCDDPVGTEIARKTRARVVTYGINYGLVQAQEIKTNADGVSFDIKEGEVVYPVRMRLLGRHNIYNGLAAFIAAKEIGIDPEVILKGLYGLKSVPGRLMLVDNDQGLNIYVDFAHTPDALKQVLTSVREFTKDRVIVIFGCGGDRDQGKRPEMGKIAVALADQVVITSDNPRSEDPLKIIRDVEAGIGGADYLVEPDRRKAIEIGVRMVEPGDILVIAGKGHEEYQIIKDKKVPFNDALVVKEILECSN